MRSLTDLLLNYPVPGVRLFEKRRICAEEASVLTGCPITSKQMQYKNEELLFSVSPVIKSALILRQHELIEKLATRGVVVRAVR